jgi:hypothetical protein
MFDIFGTVPVEIQSQGSVEAQEPKLASAKVEPKAQAESLAIEQAVEEVEVVPKVPTPVLKSPVKPVVE